MNIALCRKSKSIMDFQINIEIKLQGDDSNLRPFAKPSSDTLLNYQFS